MIKDNCILKINKKNIIHNYIYFKNLKKNITVAPTIKADAYGVGVIKVFETLYKNKCRHFFVATTEEALEIRKKKSLANVYVLNGLEGNELSTFNTHNIIPIINDRDEYKLVNQNIKKYKKLKFGVHIDTGLNRLGIDVNDFLKLTSDQNKIHILLSHLSSADEGKNN